MDFIGREYELSKLNTWYKENRFHFTVIYGRRRIGKTRLLVEFSKDKNSIFHVSTEQSDLINLTAFSKQIFSHFNMNQYSPIFSTWEDALLFLADKAREEQILIIIDEFPYLAKSNNSILSIFQKVIDHEFINTKLFLILCGSSISFMENEVLSHKSPLYGRRTGQMEITSLNFYDAQKFFPKFDIRDSLIAYGILGGVPQYLMQFDSSKSLKENIINNLFDKSSYLFREPELLIKQELRNPAIYLSIVGAIAKGASKLNEISTKIKETTAKTSVYLMSLIELKIIKKIKPITEKNSKRTIYKINDSLFSFYYSFVNPNISLIEQEFGEIVYGEIEDKLSSYNGFVFEEICQQYLMFRNKKQRLPFLIFEMGPWWGTDKKTKTQEEIDIVGLGKNNMLFAECKYTNKLVGIEHYTKLVSRSALINKGNSYYFIFSKLGFEKDLIALSNTVDNLELITFERLVTDMKK